MNKDGEGVFEHASTFEAGELSGHVQLHRFEAHYEDLFAEAIEDGIITAEERARLDRAADTLGLDRERLHELEGALRAAYSERHSAPVGEVLSDELPPLSRVDSAPALQRRIAFLEARVEQLEAELAEARAQVAVEVDLSDVEAAPVSLSAISDRPDELRRRIRLDPREPDLVRRLYRAAGQAGDVDGQLCAAHALVYLEAANAEEAELCRRHRQSGPIRPVRALNANAWRRLLFHPDEEVLTGDIFAAVVPAVLLGRVAALHSAKSLPVLDPACREDPHLSTLQAVRCFSWAATLLGMGAPPLYADPDYAGLVEVVPGVPPASRLGRSALHGRTPEELAFVAGQHLAWYREEHLVRVLLPSIPDLEDIFLAALLIGRPGLPIGADVKRRVSPIARAIEPLLEPSSIDRLRAHFRSFLEDGGRTNLQRWASAAEGTALRAGLLLANDLDAAQRMLEIERVSGLHAKMDDLLIFVTSTRYTELRRLLGIAATLHHQ
jgi:uncharacterized small protein (DUF1192 family)